MARKARIAHAPRVLETVAPDQKADLTNGITREDFLFYMGQVRKADERIAEARNARKRLRSTMKLQGVDLEIFDKVLALQEQEDDTTLSQMATLKRYAEFLSLPIGSQMTLFETPDGSGAGNSQEAVLKRAYDDGRRRGLMGLDPDSQAFPPMTPEGQEHMRGWNEGQESLMSRIKDLKDVQERADREAAAKKAAKKAKADETAGEEDPAADETVDA